MQVTRKFVLNSICLFIDMLGFNLFFRWLNQKRILILAYHGVSADQLPSGAMYRPTTSAIVLVFDASRTCSLSE